MIKFHIHLLLLFSLLQLSFSSSLKGQNHLIEGVEEYRFYIKLNPELLVDLEEGKVRFFSKTRSIDSGLKSELASNIFSQVIPLSEIERKNIRNGEPLKRVKGEFNKALFSGLLELVFASDYPKGELLEMANKFESYSDVEYCEISPLTPPPPPSMKKVAPFLRQIPDYTSQQFYLYGDQGGNISGIYADYAWSVGVYGQGVSFADIEWGWDYQHVDFAGQNVIDALTTTNHDYDDHGTGVLGEMYSADNGFGVKGCVYGADAFYGFSEITKGRTSAIAYAIDSLDPGDIIVYEMQTGGGDVDGNGSKYVPADYNQSVWDITKSATEAGYIVVAAAGNGNEDLDNSYYSSYMARGDNGSIIVGAGTKVGRNKCSFSTYGERVDVCGIGDWSIVTTGYGDLYGSGHTSYTDGFSGTSSSTPIVASAAIAVQSYAKKTYGEVISPKDMRSILKATGTPQGSGGHIGPLPNVKAAFVVVDSIYDGGTTKYTLTVENGSGSGLYEPGANITISADDAIMGQMFDSWTGDIQYVDNDKNATTVVTMPEKDISLKANYTISDTVTISDNYVLIASWEPELDTFGVTTVNVDTSKVKSDTTVSTSISLGTSNSGADKWVWAKVTGYSNGDFSKVYAIELTYSATKDINIELEQEGLSAVGANYQKLLPQASRGKVTLDINDFAQPDWVKDEPSAQAELDLTKVSAISFSGIEEGAITDLSIRGVFIYGYKEGAVSAAGNISHLEFGKIGLSKIYSDGLVLKNRLEGLHQISIFNLSGKKVYDITKEFGQSLKVDFGSHKISNGAYIIKIKGPSGVFVTNSVIR